MFQENEIRTIKPEKLDVSDFNYLFKSRFLRANQAHFIKTEIQRGVNKEVNALVY